MNERIFKYSKITFGVILGAILIQILFPKDWYMCQKIFLLPNGAMLILSGLLVALGVMTDISFQKRNRETKKSNRWDLDKIVLFMTILLFLWQCYFTYNIFFLSDWDAQVVRNGAQAIANGSAELTGFYFSTYPNNLLMTYFFAAILKINDAVGLFHGEYATMSIVLINCFLNSFACILTYKTAKLFVKERSAFFAYCLVVLSVGFSPWSVSCYSDPLVVFAPILSFYLYAKPWKHRYIKILSRMLAVAIPMLCYFIKPQCAIVLIAIMFFELIGLLRDFGLKKVTKLVVLCMTIGLTFSGANRWISFENAKTGLFLDGTRKFGASHFLMMGLNEECQGVYSGDDIGISQDAATCEERTETNLRVAKERIQKMGLAGLAGHLQNKMLITFNDGTFAWGVEGSFYAYVPEDTDQKAASFLRSVYYTNDQGENYQYLSTIQQLVWLTILTFALLSILVPSEYDQKKLLSVLWVTILGFVLYEMLFEVRARYVYIFVPIFCVLASVGFENVLHQTKGWNN